MGGGGAYFLLVIYRGLFSATLEWGAVLFTGASRSTYRILDRVECEALEAVN